MRSGRFSVRHQERAYGVAIGPPGRAQVDGGPPLTIEAEGDGEYRVSDGTRSWWVLTTADGDRRQIFVDGDVYDLVVEADTPGQGRGHRAGPEVLSAPMPARVTAIVASVGQAARKGDVLLKLEAMKMEMPVRAPRDGTVTRINCRVGELVQPGVVLLELA